MKHADMAMYVAKEGGKNQFQFYSKDLRSQSLERLAIENHLRYALERKELSLNYQARVELKTGKIDGMEALIRWNNPELGQVSPMQFLPVAEDGGLILAIGRWVLRTACAQSVAWHQQGLPPLFMAVNLSERQFYDPHLLSDLSEVLAATGMSSHLLELEVTESTVMRNPPVALAQLRAIKNLGMRIAIDDFGTGYTALGQLKEYPIDTLKVDRSFMRVTPSDEEGRSVTEAILAMGKTLSLTVVAEGVETEEQVDFLRRRGCDQMQGYYFSKPLAADHCAELVLRHQPPETTLQDE
jgi:EAL domain-containing protein (putative c-di-GMP-specific phosphodiesterase class I)